MCQNSQCHYCVTAFWQNGSFLHSGLTKDVMPRRATLQKLPQSGHLPKGGELDKSKSGRAGLWLSAGCLSNVHKILDSIPAVQTHWKKNPKTQRRANMESIWRSPLLPIWPEQSSQGQNNPPTDQSREPRAPNFTQHIPKLLQSQVHFLSRSQNEPASSLG